MNWRKFSIVRNLQVWISDGDYPVFIATKLGSDKPSSKEGYHHAQYAVEQYGKPAISAMK